MTDGHRQIVQETLEEHRTLLARFERNGIEVVGRIAEMITQSLTDGGTLYLCGNGGSAADAQHIAGEFVGRFRTERRALPAVALSTDTSVLTCVANDYDYQSVFARQVEALMKKDDVLWAFSTSGTSANVLKAAEAARRKGARVIAFTGRSNSPLEARADLCLCAEAQVTARSQEIHQLAYHIVCDLVERSFTQ
ncbi:MAG TPA: SIS domain-containing protein [Sedimentisphaerales bacterium]|nr:SIS domain-containing protein [Sedimentisphaerales bacterium]HRS11972.1 SIS domain-containing protein [Sedimentisphaerales bacterium]HRV49028.1 SIS domain-containing protein [Sedimentisphaerales bacterium]